MTRGQRALENLTGRYMIILNRKPKTISLVECLRKRLATPPYAHSAISRS